MKTALFSIGLLICSIFCFVGLYFVIVNSGNSCDGWSKTPLLWFQIINISPIFCSIIGVALWYDHKRTGNRLTWMDQGALSAGFLALIVGGLFLAMIMSSMGQMGISLIAQ